MEVCTRSPTTKRHSGLIEMCNCASADEIAVRRISMTTVEPNDVPSRFVTAETQPDTVQGRLWVTYRVSDNAKGDE